MDILYLAQFHWFNTKAYPSYYLHVRVHSSLQPEAAKIMQDAVMEFEGTPEELRINIANADLAINRGDIDGALTMLRNVGPEQVDCHTSEQHLISIERRQL